MPVPLTPTSMQSRSPMGWGANTPGTALLAATAREMLAPDCWVTTHRSPV